MGFIEERLFWIGEVNRTDLVQRFGVSMGQASGDIARYLALGPVGVSYDKSAKRYVADSRFRPLLAKPDSARFLTEIRLVESGLISIADTQLGWLPPFDATPLPERTVDPFVLRALIGAIRGRRVLDIEYQSMSRPEPTPRSIEPHALVYDGFRWHARAFDHDQQDYRDFVLGRINRPRLGGQAQSTADNDIAWNREISLEIAPHPKLSPSQSKAIALDYGLGEGGTTIRVRQALLFYALRRLGLDIDPNVRPPQEQHIVLVNRDEIDPMLDGEAH